MITSIVLLVVSLIGLTAGALFLVRGGVRIAVRLGLSSFFVGLTIVGFGTSAPELSTSISSALAGRGEINLGNVIGSNIFNIAVILGLTAILAPIAVRTEVVRREALIVIGTAAIPMGAGLFLGGIPRWLGGAMFALLLVYIWRGAVIGRREPVEVAAEATEELKRETGAGGGPRFTETIAWSVGLVLIGLALLVGGSRLLVTSATDLARTLGLSDMVIALTIVAGGTSAPELATSLMAAARRQADIAIGNILGSNVFNILMILGVTSVVQPQEIGRQTLLLDGPVMIALSVACLPIMLSGRRISRGEGAILLVCYAVYVAVLLTMAPRWFGA